MTVTTWLSVQTSDLVFVQVFLWLLEKSAVSAILYLIVVIRAMIISPHWGHCRPFSSQWWSKHYKISSLHYVRALCVRVYTNGRIGIHWGALHSACVPWPLSHMQLHFVISVLVTLSTSERVSRPCLLSWEMFDLGQRAFTVVCCGRPVIALIDIGLTVRGSMGFRSCL